MKFSLLDDEELWAKKLKLNSGDQITEDFKKDGLGDILSLFTKKKKRKRVTFESKSTREHDNISLPASIVNIELQRRFRGQLNRLSESNISKIASTLEPLFQTHSFNESREALTLTLLDVISIQINLLEGFIATFAALITALSNRIGTHLIIHFVTVLVKRLFNLLSDNSVSNNRIVMNFIHMISFLYTFQAIGTTLLYDLIKHFIGVMNELSIEILLKLLCNSGSQLYQDDPSALKDIILLVQSQKFKLSQEQTNSSRFKFLLEMLDDLKNNKKKLVKDPSDNINSILKSTKPTFAPLSLTISSIFEDKQDNSISINEKPISINISNSLLLKAQRAMNTDVRRAIFIVIMGSEDYLDACERLSKLQLTSKQIPEIPRVIIYCCQYESSFNPYYLHLSTFLIRTEIVRSKSFVFCLWDIIESIQNGEIFQILHIYHLGKLFGNLLSKDISILSLKTVKFDMIEFNSHLFLFLTLIISEGILGLTSNEWFDSFQKIGTLEQYISLKEGLLYFFSKWNDKMKKLVNLNDQRHIEQYVNTLLDIMNSSSL